MCANNKIGEQYSGSICIDEISYKDNLCSYVPPTTQAPSTTTPFPKTALDCDFEAFNMCQWKSDQSAKFSWLLNRGRTATPNTGPSGDHTTSSEKGVYIYTESGYPLKENDSARIVSPAVKMRSGLGGCLKFYYHMYGSDVNTLNVNMQSSKSAESSTAAFSPPIWRKHGNQGNYWLFGHVFVDSANDLFYRFQLEGLVSAWTK